MLGYAHRFIPALAAAGVVLVVVALGLRAERGTAPAAPPATAAAALAAFVAFQQSAVADPAELEGVQRLAADALEARPGDPEAIEVQARVAGSRHDFRTSLGLARASLRRAPERVGPQGLAADSLIELGRYREGFRLAEQRLRLRPDLGSYARASYAAELRGQVGLALDHMELAAESGEIGGFPRGWARLQLALLRLRTGDVAGARKEYGQLAAERPNDPELPIGRARIAAARGHLAEAARWYRRGVAALPDADHYVELAEVELARGRHHEARAALKRASAAFDRLAGVEDVGLERAAFDADWARPTPDDVARARSARARRPSIYGDAAFAWTLTRAGRCKEAAAPATRSLRLGTRDPLLLFRAGQAAACAGDREAARRRLRTALRISPRFSLRWAPVARRQLARLS